MRLIRLVPFGLVFGLVAGCGGSDTSSGAGAGGDGNADGGISVEELPAKYADAFCQVFTNCVGDLYSVYRPGESCVKDLTVTFDEALAPLGHAIDAKRVTYDGTKVQKCLDEIAAGDCTTLARREPESCKIAVAGTVKEGEDCTLDFECAGDQYCKTGDTCPGKCAAYENAGSACVSNDNCASGLKCDDNGHCVKPAEKGAACQQGEPDCADGLLCLGQDSTAKTPGSCYTIDEAFGGKEGEACSLDGHLCATGFSCEITTLTPIGGTCVAKVASGAVCHAAFLDECPEDQYCALGANPLMPGKCTDKPKAGEKCAPTLGDSVVCAPYTRCDNGVCRDIAHAGEDCTVNDTCYSGHCVDGACVTGNSCQ